VQNSNYGATNQQQRQSKVKKNKNKKQYLDILSKFKTTHFDWATLDDADSLPYGEKKRRAMKIHCS
jgi:hypothetical protein